MIIELFILFQVVMLATFFTAFFTQQEILWGVSFILSGVLMITSFFIQHSAYVFDVAQGAYVWTLVNNSYPFLSGINFLFFALSLTLGLFDIYDKYGLSSKSIGGRL